VLVLVLDRDQIREIRKSSRELPHVQAIAGRHHRRRLGGKPGEQRVGVNLFAVA
jgi:hypothetical protein